MTTTIADLTPDPTNRRRHTERNLAMLVDALTDVGAARSIVIDEHNTVLAGNGVIEAARSAGLSKLHVVETDGDTIVAVRRSNLTPEQKRSLALFDNRTAELAEWNVEQLAADAAAGLDFKPFFLDEELRDILGTKIKTGRTDPDDVPAQRSTSIVRGDLFALGPHRLLCGDATNAADVARVCDGALVDCGFTSPPYGVGLDYGGDYKDTHAECVALLRGVALTAWDAVKIGGYFLTNFGDVISGKALTPGATEPCEFPMAVVYWEMFRAAGWLLHTRRIWAKPHARVAAPWCASSNRAASDFEHIWSWKKPGIGLNERRDPSYYGVWDTSKMEGVELGKDIHPAAMPVSLPIIALGIYSEPNDLILEPFTGTGTTLIACDRVGRRAAAIEISPSYCQMTIDRWEAFTGQRAVKVGEAPPPS